MSRTLERLRAALAAGGETLDDLAHAVGQGKARVWRRGDDGVVVTQVRDAGPVRELHFWLAAGEMAVVLDLVDEAIEWGRACGCGVATLSGRRGWARVLASRGWQAASRRGVTGLLEMARVI